MNNTPILVTGGTGFIGSYLLRKLILDGYTHIRALRRKNSNWDLVQDIKDQVDWIEGDVLDVFALEDAMQGIQKIYHCAAVVSYDPRDKKLMKKVNVEGTANVVNAALNAHISKMVYVSSIAAIGRNEKTKIIHENLKWEKNSLNSTYAKTKYLAEKEVWRGMAEGLPAVIINPSVVLGSGHWKKGSTMIFYSIWKGLKFFPQGSTGFVDVRDVVTLMVKMMNSNVTDARFIANGENWPFKKIFQLMAKSYSKKGPTIPVTPLLRSVAWRIEWFKSMILRSRPMITKETSLLSMKSFLFDNTKSKEVFQFVYRPLEETIQETSKQLIKASKNNFKPEKLPFS